MDADFAQVAPQIIGFAWASIDSGRSLAVVFPGPGKTLCVGNHV
ncbi:hypothetical protein K239x_07930 [Planctomycetes bacterium K23_9]|uniref:Uncharacterized protein n=1 Tax=Stieleria marina TaxID=1930275 RepID=A0A517NNZ6_9BACT|nr:hypothetical protein K239x_07930 [Planctomycetes bacterium K23_9]